MAAGVNLTSVNTFQIEVQGFGFKGSEVQGFKVSFASLDCIWDAYLGEKRQLRQARFKIWSQIGNCLGK